MRPPRIFATIGIESFMREHRKKTQAKGRAIHERRADRTGYSKNADGVGRPPSPSDAGADIIIGSLIKNAGGGITRTGGYIAGRTDLVELCSYRLTCVGMGKEVGCTLGMNREILLGLFFAPDVVASALKTSAFASELMTMLGFECSPRKDENHGDIVTAIQLGDEEHLTAFCRGIQKGAPVDSFVVPEAWDMPGYSSQVIMAAGAFTNGASIELSADAPIREPFAVWMQGGITYTSGKIGVMLAVQEMIDSGLINLDK